MSHDPGLVIDTNWQDPRLLEAALSDPASSPELEAHTGCDLLGGRYSYPLIEVYCPPRRDAVAHHTNLRLPRLGGPAVTGWRFWEPTRRQLRAELDTVRERLRSQRQLTQDRTDQLEALRGRYDGLLSEHLNLGRTHTATLAQLDGFLERTRTTPCTKIRLIDQPEAQQFAADLAVDTGRDPSEFHAYRCPDCPRRPVAGTRYWHVANSDPSLRTNRSDGRRVRAAKAQRDREVSQAGRMLRQHVTPADIAALRRKTKEAS